MAVLFIGHAMNAPGLFDVVAAPTNQFAIMVPANAPNGDPPIVAQVAGVSSPANIYLTVQQ